MNNTDHEDMEIAVCMAGHIMYPCGAPKGPNLRDFHIRLSRDLIDRERIRAPHAVSMLLEVIEIYEREVYNGV